MDFMKALYRAHVLRVAFINQWFFGNEQLPDWRAWVRAETYLRLDMLIHELWDAIPETQNHQSLAAVQQLVSLHTDCSAVQAVNLSFPEGLDVLRSILEGVCIPPELLVYPEHVQEQLQNVQPIRRQLVLPTGANYSGRIHLARF